MPAGSKWGGSPTNKDYALYMKTSAEQAAQILEEHSMTGVSQELSEKVTIPVKKTVAGRSYYYNKTIRAPYELSRTYNMGFPPSLWTPAMARAARGGDCSVDLYLVSKCPPSSEEAHAIVMPGVFLDPPVETNDFLVNDVSEEAIKYQTTAHVSDHFRLWHMWYGMLIDDTLNTQSVDFDMPECPTCEETVFTDLRVGASAGTSYYSENRLATKTTTVDTVYGSANVRDILANGDQIILAFGGEKAAGTAAAAAGGIRVSYDNGLTYTTTNVTVPINSMTKFKDLYVAVGGLGTGATVIYTSKDGMTWTLVVDATLAATTNAAATGVAADEESNALYVVTYSGTTSAVYKLVTSGDFWVVTTITANLPSLTGIKLESVNVYSKDHVAVGGNSGYFAESFDGGVTWTKTFSGGANTIFAIAGDESRSFLSAGVNLYERSPLTNFMYKIKTRSDSTSALLGVILDIAKGDENYWLVAATSGQIMMLKPSYPNS